VFGLFFIIDLLTIPLQISFHLRLPPAKNMTGSTTPECIESELEKNNAAGRSTEIRRALA
jgi:hypothetical protein